MAENVKFNSMTCKHACNTPFGCPLCEMAKARAERDKYEVALRKASKWLDAIKFDLNASVYTLTDDEFEMVFATRDMIDEALEKPSKGGAQDA